MICTQELVFCEKLRFRKIYQFVVIRFSITVSNLCTTTAFDMIYLQSSRIIEAAHFTFPAKPCEKGLSKLFSMFAAPTLRALVVRLCKSRFICFVVSAVVLASITCTNCFLRIALGVLWKVEKLPLRLGDAFL